MEFSEMIEQIRLRQRDLELKWLAAQQVWNDPVSHSFEQRYLAPTNRQAINLYGSLKNLEVVLRSIDNISRQSDQR